MTKGDEEGAPADLNEAVKLNATGATVYFNRAFVLREKGDLIQALTDYDQTIALGPLFADAWAMRGLLKLRLHREADAQEDFDQCLRLNPALRASLDTLVQTERLQLASKP